jgi:DNA-binding CsgD family transcriptional regulator
LINDLDTEEDWKNFLIKFEEKHTNFFKKLKAGYPALTSTDLRLCACLKLNMETKDIASLMSLSVRAVENNRYRLRKKLNLATEQNLNEFFISFD